MKNVERIRERILRGQMGELMRLRVFISMLGENQEAVDRLLGPSGDVILAKVADLILVELGAEVATQVDDRFSKTRRAAAKRLRG